MSKSGNLNDISYNSAGPNVEDPENTDLFPPARASFRGIKHVRRGAPMKETYWEQFMMTGRIDDYLNYKNRSTESWQSGTDTRDGGLPNAGQMQDSPSKHHPFKDHPFKDGLSKDSLSNGSLANKESVK